MDDFEQYFWETWFSNENQFKVEHYSEEQKAMVMFRAGFEYAKRKCACQLDMAHRIIDVRPRN